MEIGERIYLLRKSLNLSQEEFGDKLGLVRSAISSYESGRRNLSEHSIKSICREFNVNYIWLVSGDGEMFLDVSNAILDQLATEYDLTDDDKEIINNYISLDSQSRAVFTNYLRGLFKH